MGSLDKIKLKLEQYFVHGLIQDKIRPLSLWQEKNQIFLLFENNKTQEKYQMLAKSHDAFSFETIKQTKQIKQPLAAYPKAAIVNNYDNLKNQVMYFGTRSVKIAFSQNGVDWQEADTPLIIRPKPIEVDNVFVHRRIIILLFYEKNMVNGLRLHNAHLAFFDRDNPQKLLYQTQEPIWEQAKLWPNELVVPIGTAEFSKQLISYWYKPGQGIFAVIFTDFLNEWSLLQKNICN